MKIVFYPVNCSPFHGRSLEEKALGGTETAVIHLAEALGVLGHEVTVVTEAKGVPETRPKYIPLSRLDKSPIDAFITIRGWEGVFHPVNAKRRFFWSGDAWSSSYSFGIGDKRFVEKVDNFFAVSKWQAVTLCNASGFPFEKTSILRNGILLEDFSGVEKRRKRLIYTSTPNRGLQHLVPIYKKLLEKHPDLELYVYSSFDRYHKKGGDRPFKKLFKELSSLPGVHLHGSIPQKELAREFMKASILAYPCDYEETSCITVMEAQAAGCTVVTSDLAALKETVGEAGFVIPGDPSSEEYQRQFIEACDLILKDKTVFKQFSEKSKKQAQVCAWSARAEELEMFLANRYGLL